MLFVDLLFSLFLLRLVFYDIMLVTIPATTTWKASVSNCIIVLDLSICEKQNVLTLLSKMSESPKMD